MEERQGPFTCQCGFLLLAIQVICYVCSEAQQWPTLCNHMDCSPTGSSVQGILPARILEWAPFPPPGDLPNPGIEPMSLTSPALAGGFFSTSTTWARSQKILNAFCSAVNLPLCAIHPFLEAEAGPHLPVS